MHRFQWISPAITHQSPVCCAGSLCEARSSSCWAAAASLSSLAAQQWWEQALLHVMQLTTTSTPQVSCPAVALQLCAVLCSLSLSTLCCTVLPQPQPCSRSLRQPECCDGLRLLCACSSLVAILVPCLLGWSCMLHQQVHCAVHQPSLSVRVCLCICIACCMHCECACCAVVPAVRGWLG